MKRYVVLLSCLPAVALAQSASELQAKITALQAAKRAAQSAGDNAWMLTSAALVLMMTGPGRPQERIGRHDAKFHYDGGGNRPVGRGRLQQIWNQIIGCGISWAGDHGYVNRAEDLRRADRLASHRGAGDGRAGRQHARR